MRLTGQVGCKPAWIGRERGGLIKIAWALGAIPLLAKSLQVPAVFFATAVSLAPWMALIVW